MRVQESFVLPNFTKKKVRIRILSNTKAEKDAIINIINEMVEVDGNIMRIKPDTMTHPNTNTIYVKTNTLNMGLYREEFESKAISVRELIKRAYKEEL